MRCQSDGRRKGGYHGLVPSAAVAAMLIGANVRKTTSSGNLVKAMPTKASPVKSSAVGRPKRQDEAGDGP